MRQYGNHTSNTGAISIVHVQLYIVPHIIMAVLIVTADREVQRILLELLNQMDGFDQNVNVKVTLTLPSYMEEYK